MTRTRKRTFRKSLVSFTLGSLAALVASPAEAQTNWVTAGAGPFNFNLAGNWSAGVPSQGVTGVFPAGFPGMPAMITLNANTTVGGLTFADAVDGTIGVAGGSVLTLNNNGAGATLAFNAQNATGWTVQPNITLADNAIFSVANGVSGTISGAISGPVGNSVTKSGNGTLTLSSANTFAGPTIVNDGTLLLTTGGALGGTSMVTLNGDSLLQQTATGTISNAAALVLNGTSTFDLNGTIETVGSLAGAGGTRVLLGGGTLQTFDGSTTTFAGVISENGTLRHTGAGTLNLTGANTFTGTTLVDGGGVLSLNVANALQNINTVTVSNASTLQTAVTGAINNAAAVTVNDTSMFNIGMNSFETIGTLSGAGNVNLANGSTLAISANGGNFSGIIAGTGNFQKNTAGTQILSGANTFTGTTLVSDGSTLALNGAGALGGTSGVTITGAGSQLMLGANNAINDAASVNVNSPGSVFDLNGFSETIGGLNGVAGSSVTLGGGALSVNGGGTFNGVISEAGTLTKAGAATLTLGGVNTFGGPTTVNGGTLTVSNTGSLASAVTVNNGSTLNVNNGGQVNNNVTVANGTANVNGQVNGTATINTGTLNGTGSAGAVVVNNGGTIAPGNASIGTFTVSGNGAPAFTQNAGSTYQMQVNNAGMIAGVNNDLIALTNAAATANLGGTVNLVDTTAGGFYKAGTTFTILTTANPAGVNGTYGNITTTNLAANRTAVLMHNADNVQVQVQRTAGNFAAAAMTRNQRNVGTVLDGVNALAMNDLGAVLDTMVLLPNAQKKALLDQMSGELHASVAGNVVQSTSQFVDMVSRRLRTNSPGSSGIYGPTVPAIQPMFMGSHTTGAAQQIGLTDAGDFVVRAQGVGIPSYGGGYGALAPAASGVLGSFWASGYGVKGDVDGNMNGNPFDYTLAGTAFGVEQNLSPVLLMGLVGGYSHNDLDMNKPKGSAQVESYHAGVYGHLTEGIGYTSGLVSVGYQEYDTTRQIMLPPPVGTRTARGSYDGHELTAYIEKGLNLSLGGLRVQPLVGLQYIGLQRDAFTETGAGALNLSLIEDHVESLRLSAGGRIAPEIPAGFFGAIVPEIRGRWVHELLDDNQALSANFAGAPGANFVANSADLGRNFGVVGAGLNAQLSPTLRVYVDYDYTFSDSLEAHAGSGGVEFLW